MNERVELSCPAEPRYLYLIRVLVGAVASRLALNVVEVEDLYLVVDELCLSLLNTGGDAPGELCATIEWRSEELSIHCRRTGLPTGSSSLPVATSGISSAFAGRILDALTDEHGTAWEGDVPVAWMKTNRRPDTPPS